MKNLSSTNEWKTTKFVYLQIVDNLSESKHGMIAFEHFLFRQIAKLFAKFFPQVH